MSFQDQNPESARTVIAPAVPARRATARTSDTKRSTPRAVCADPLRILADRTSPVPARVASSG